MIRTTIYLPLGRAAGLGVSQFDSSRTRAVAAMMPAWHERLQTSLIMGTRNSGYDRAGQNWYQEPSQYACRQTDPARAGPGSARGCRRRDTWQ